MHAIAYVSTATWELSDADLEFIVSESRGRNMMVDVTGVLLYCDGNFMQYLEGPKEAVRETYARIRASQRHRQVNELLNHPIAEREFGEWTLGFSRTSALDFLELAAAPWEDHGKVGPGAQLLHTFWRNCRFQAA